MKVRGSKCSHEPRDSGGRGRALELLMVSGGGGVKNVFEIEKKKRVLLARQLRKLLVRRDVGMRCK